VAVKENSREKVARERAIEETRERIKDKPKPV
jgi:hypothetical protein